MNLTDHIELPNPEVYGIPWVLNHPTNFVVVTYKHTDSGGSDPVILHSTKSQIEAEAVRDEIRTRMRVLRTLSKGL